MIGNVSTFTGAVPLQAVSPAAPAAASPPVNASPSVVVTLSGLDEAPASPTYTLQRLLAATEGSSRDTRTTATMSIKTASGKTILFGMDGNIQGSAALDDTEKAAVAKLADAFQDALDGVVSVPPKIDLDGLIGFDPTMLASVDFTAQTSRDNAPQTTLAFHADAVSRTVKMTGTSGSIDIGIDTSSPAILGSAAQRKAALANYMHQFGQAASRGHGDPSLMAMFKDAFSQLASAPAAPSGTVPMRSTLSPGEHSVLTGMPDFHASVVEAGSSPNPLKPAERDGFSYEVSQETKVKGTNPLNRGVSQHLHAQLSASYHSPLRADASLMLTLDPKSQNYLYTHVDDVADSQADIAYRKGKLVLASITQSASQSTEQSKYIMGKLVEQTTMPYSKSTTHDVLGLLKSIEDDGSAPTRQKQAERDRVLAGIHAFVGLESDPSRLP